MLIVTALAAVLTLAQQALALGNTEVGLQVRCICAVLHGSIFSLPLINSRLEFCGLLVMAHTAWSRYASNYLRSTHPVGASLRRNCWWARYKNE